MKPKNKNTQRIQMFALIVGILACLGLCFLGYKVLTHKTTVSQPTTAGSVSDHPDVAKEGSDETPVATTSLASYKVADDEPRILKIDSIGINARIRPMNVNSLGAIQAPINIYDSGWYTSSSKPGGYGAMFIDGHASGATREGLFAYLDTLQIGNQVSVEKGDGEVLNYKVVHVETVPKDSVDMSKALRTYNGVKEGLNLMTCSGKWINSEKTLDKRTIVYTERVS
jgi:LPXTG-site transpeptidase (sortase) family protein